MQAAADAVWPGAKPGNALRRLAVRCLAEQTHSTANHWHCVSFGALSRQLAEAAPLLYDPT